VNIDQSDYFERFDLLTSQSAQNFPSSVTEVQDAGSCYALDQHAASVMHSMRALELALIAFANEVGAKSSREQWHRIISDIANEVNGIGPSSGVDWRERKEFYSGACQEFRPSKTRGVTMRCTRITDITDLRPSELSIIRLRF
jgi:hypothetical protein